TSRCPLKCDHCYEWDTMSSVENLGLEQLKTILERLLERGVAQIQFSGGEPMVRFADLLELIRSTGRGTDLWLLTSGYGLTAEKAEALRDAGLKGVNISLDHWEEKAHNRYRGRDDSFAWVLESAEATRRAGLALCLSLCARREFVSRENLMRYLRLAGELGAFAVQLLEPRKSGRYSDSDIELSSEQIGVLEDFFMTVTLEKAHDNDPLVSYPGHHQRLEGCFGAGERYLHIDSRGDLHACPFCRGRTGNALDADIDGAIDRLRKTGCHAFRQATAGR
ncbi:MAG TPA: radical SAM protein, partial [Candidatus Krumholzibacterium sp.]|nr:radical SAM protein [Candidatus Krumholzibacterium sp.]